ncbi:MAG: GRP family sugar transporter [Candidatus Thermoplasmatota archaeon]|nr:GRP family sugar transporter [Candidatus Thermoplasmatota archaeon]MDI6856356.1 GRP family sugar transporter [Candidatus Thermoplasmatota archaeon]MDI6887131.1 GRP family sugar transporter [Candidatus Thermoplasmatota archaeon]
MEYFCLIIIIISSFLFGSQFVPKKFSKVNEIIYCAAMSSGIFLNALVLTLLLTFKSYSFSYSYHSLVICFVAGFVWLFGNVLLIYAVTRIGIARPFVILNFTSVISFFGGIIFLREYAGLYSLIQAFIAMLIIIAGCIVITETISKARKHSRIGIVAAFSSSIFFGIFNILVVHSVNILKLDVVLAALSLSSGSLLASISFLIVSRKFLDYLTTSGREQSLGIVGGIIWGLGNITSLYALKTLGLSIGIPILMGLITFFSACWGIIAFKELERSAIPKFILGALLTLGGVVLIAL